MATWPQPLAVCQSLGKACATQFSGLYYFVPMNKIRKIWSTLGPGFLYAGAAIGVSHLVQSTKAGAQYGFTLLGIVIISNVLKYPFFEAGPRYAAATGENLIQGYQRIGKWAVWMFTMLTASTAFIIQAAVTIVTAALFSNLIGIDFTGLQASAILLAICGSILFVGQYKWLDTLIKWVVVLLTVATIIAFFKAQTVQTEISLWPSWVSSESAFVFLFALMGWMPAPVDIAAWHSIWTVEKQRESGSESPKTNLDRLKEALRDFHIGYWGTAVLAMIFLSLGALVLYANGVAFNPPSGAEFSKGFIQIYTDTLGSWTYPIIAFAAFAAMFSTTITVLDGAPRVADELVPALQGKQNNQQKLVYRITVVVIALGALLLIGMYAGKSAFGTLIKIATITSFVTAPLLGFLNFKLAFSDHMPQEARPSQVNKIVSIIGLVFLGSFALVYSLYVVGLVSF